MCTLTGLTPSTGYSFQLVAFTGTLNINAVFGGLSNVTTATTTATPPPPPPPPPPIIQDSIQCTTTLFGRASAQFKCWVARPPTGFIRLDVRPQVVTNFYPGSHVQLCPFLVDSGGKKWQLAPYDTIPACRIEWLKYLAEVPS